MRLRALGRFDSLIDAYGAWAVLVLRLFPVVSYDFVSYAAGMTVMRPGRFGLATFVGMLPATIAFSLLGGSVDRANRWSLIGGAALLGALLIGAVCMRRSAAWRNAGGGRRSPCAGPRRERSQRGQPAGPVGAEAGHPGEPATASLD